MRITLPRYGAKGPYVGPLCYVPFDHLGPDGKALVGGWHYSTKVHKRLRPFTSWGEIPDRRLHLNDEGLYEYAEKGHRSHLEKHGPGNVTQLRALNGDHPPEAFSDHPLHAEFRKSLGEAS